MMPILVRCDDVRSGRKANLVTGGYGWHRSQWVKDVTYCKTLLEKANEKLHVTAEAVYGLFSNHLIFTS